MPEAAESAPEQLPASTDTSEPGSAEQSDAPEPSAVAPPTAPLAAQYGPPPPSPTGPLDPALEAIIDDLYGNVTEGISRDAVAAIGQSGDPRLAWLVSDILRFIFTQRGVADLVVAVRIGSCGAVNR